MAADTGGDGRFSRLLDRFPALARLGEGPRRPVPVVQQLTDTECGAACLAMVLAHHGREVSLEAVRDLCPGGRDGVTARDIVEAAAPLGLRGRGVKAQPAQLPQLPPGATILHWELQHFVVLARMHRRGVDIVDPAVGRRTIDHEELSRSWSGVALVFEPNDLFRRERRAGEGLFALLRRLALETGLVRRILVLSLALQLFGLALPVLTGQVIDRVLPRADVSLLATMLVGLAVLVGFRSLAQVIRAHLLLRLGTLLDARLTMGFLDHLVDLPLSFFGKRSAGDLLMRLHSNAILRDRLTTTALSAMLDGLMVCVYLAVLLLGNGALAATALLAAGLEVGAFVLVRRPQRELAAEELHREARTHGYEVELVTAIETLKATGCEQRAVSHWSNLFVDQLNVKLRRERLSIATEGVLAGLRLAGPLALLAVGAVEVLHARLSLGGMLALAAVAGAFLEPVSSLVQTVLSLEIVRGNLRRVNDVLDAAPEQQGPALRRAPALTGRIDVERVSFRYQPGAPLVLDDISLSIAPGQFVAIVGPSGSGKTTLANVILGLHPPERGRVLFDRLDVRALDLRSVRQQLGVVDQSFGLFGATVRDNIALADPTLPLAAVEAAAAQACLHDDIVALPLGYDTPLGDRGTALSGGQRQRLALARALVRQPAILLLDEATSALDAATERRVQAALAALACTRIVIAHRLSTVRRADQILMVEHGRIVERGTHQALLSAAGAYARLVASQLEEEQEEPA
jgi:ATP-binding cassette, subfamily B, bacterial